MKKYRGPAHGSPYPLSRLAPKFDLIDIKNEIATAQSALTTIAGVKLEMIATQISYLQEEARKIIYKAQEDMILHEAQCNFIRRVGQTYHLYSKEDGINYFSLISPVEWEYRNPHQYIGSYRLEGDMSWTRVDVQDFSKTI